MSDPSVPTDASTDVPLQFESAHAGEAPTTVCTSCSEPIRGVYHEANGNVVCSRCRGKLEVLIASTGGMRRFRRAAGFGLGAAIGCAVAYGAFRAYSDWDSSLIAIFVGLAVGKAVFVGAERRGGRRYQVLAALLTYFAIASSYVPLAVKELKERPSAAADSSKAATKRDSTTAAAAELPTATKKTADKPMGFGGFLVGVGALMLLVLALPIMVGMGSIISVVILALGLVQAWRMNKAVTINVSGPYRIADPASAAEPATA
ncbi:MAG: hypothetical protein JWL61_4654 [Gemmatimonadetes bacterium]|nr:hypothetical protein [Gemmatimonadota bacterium]